MHALHAASRSILFVYLLNPWHSVFPGHQIHCSMMVDDIFSLSQLSSFVIVTGECKTCVSTARWFISISVSQHWTFGLYIVELGTGFYEHLAMWCSTTYSERGERKIVKIIHHRHSSSDSFVGWNYRIVCVCVLVLKTWKRIWIYERWSRNDVVRVKTVEWRIRGEIVNKFYTRTDTLNYSC